MGIVNRDIKVPSAWAYMVLLHPSLPWCPGCSVQMTEHRSSCGNTCGGDLKALLLQLENTLLDGSRRPLVKICDFGYSKHLRQDSLPKSKVGTPGYTGVISLGCNMSLHHHVHLQP